MAKKDALSVADAWVLYEALGDLEDTVDGLLGEDAAGTASYARLRGGLIGLMAEIRETYRRLGRSSVYTDPKLARPAAELDGGLARGG